MATILPVRPVGPVARWADTAMEPLMQWLMNDPEECPQRTHRWNNRRLTRQEAIMLDRSLTVKSSEREKMSRRGKILFHLPRFGGWQNYVVLEPTTPCTWHVGWIAGDVSGVSRIPLTGPVRVLLGGGIVFHFGISTDGNRQIALRKIGEGIIGEPSPYKHVLLL